MYKRQPQLRSEYLNKTLNIFTNALNAYFDIEEFRASDHQYEWTLEELSRLPIVWYGGADLSKLHDLTAGALYGTYKAVSYTHLDEQNKYIIQLFLIKKEELKEETKYNYLNAIKKLLTQIDKPLTEMTDIDIKQYLRWYEQRNVDKTGKVNKASTVNNERRYLSAFFCWMRVEKLIFDNPVESVGKKRTDKGQIDYYTQEEIEKLREGCQTKRDRAMIEVLRSTGLRVGEFCSLKIEDVDFKTGDVWVRREKGGLNTPAYIDEAAKMCIRDRYLRRRR